MVWDGLLSETAQLLADLEAAQAARVMRASSGSVMMGMGGGMGSNRSSVAGIQQLRASAGGALGGGASFKSVRLSAGS